MSLQVLEINTQEGQQLYAKIKRSSKYYGQSGRNEIFPVYVCSGPDWGEYIVQGGPGGQYRLCDVNLFIVHAGYQQRIA